MARKKRDPYSDPYVPTGPGTYAYEQAHPASATPHWATRLATIELASAGTLPTSVSFALASHMGFTDDKQAYHAARLIARQTAIPPKYLFSKDKTTNANDFIVNGQAMSAADARRLLKPYEAAVIASMLSPYAKGTSDVIAGSDLPPGRRYEPIVIPGHPPIRPERIARAVKALAPVTDPTWKINDLLGVAVSVAATPKMNMDTFAHNLVVAMAAHGIIDVGGRPTRAGPLPVPAALQTSKAISIAQAAAANGVTLNTSVEVLAFLNPNLGEAIAASKKVQALIDPNTYMANIPPELAKGDPNSPSYDPNSMEAQIVLRNAQVQAQAHVASAEHLAITTPALQGIDGRTISAILNSIGDTEDNYVKTADEIAKNIQIQSDQFHHSLFMRVVNDTLFPLKRAYDLTVGEGWQVVGGLTKMQGGSGLGGFGETWKDMRDVFFNRRPYLDTKSLEFVPTWEKVGLDLFVGWYLAPDQIGLRLLSEAKQARSFAFGAETTMEAFHSFLNDPVARIGQWKGMTVSDAIVHSVADNPTAPERGLAVLNNNFINTFGTNGLNPWLYDTVHAVVSSELKIGRPFEEISQDVKSVLSMGFGFKYDPGSLADRISILHDNIETATAQSLPNSLADIGTYASDAATYGSAEATRALSALTDWQTFIMDTRAGIGVFNEAPTLANPAARAFRGAFDELADTKLGTAAKALFNDVPEVRAGYIRFDLANPAATTEDVRSWLVRYRGVLNKDQLEAKVLEAANVLRPGADLPEANFQAFLDATEEQVISAAAKRKNIRQEDIDQILEHIKGKYAWKQRGAPKEVYGVLTAQDVRTGYYHPATLPVGIEPQPIDLPQPAGITQLRNEFKVMDPVAVNVGLGEYKASIKYMEESILKGMKEMNGLKSFANTTKLGAAAMALDARKLARASTDLFIRDMFLRWWKPLAVTRPAYAIRVPLTEEQLRFLSTSGLMDRIYAGKLSSALLEKFGMGPGDYRFLVDGQEIVLPGMAGRGLTQGTPEFDNSITRFGAPQESLGRLGQRRLYGAGGTELGVPTRLIPSDPNFYNAWHWTLTRQFPQDHAVLGPLLKAVADGKTEEQAATDLVENLLKPENQTDLRRFMQGASAGGLKSEAGPTVRFSHEAVDAQVRVSANLVYTYTAGNGGLARAALNDTLSPDLLRAVIDTHRPNFVHGIETEMASGEVGRTKGTLETISKFILQDITNTVSRRPYGRMWYDRMVKNLVDHYTGGELGTIERTLAEPAMLANSAVRDSSGSLIRVYHGTPETFSEFALKDTETLYGPNTLFFAEDPAVAGSNYALGANAPTQLGATFTTKAEADAFAAEHNVVGVRELTDTKGRPFWAVDYDSGLGANVHFAYLDIKHPFDTTATVGAVERGKMVDYVEAHAGDTFDASYRRLRIDPMKAGPDVKGGDAYMFLEDALGGKAAANDALKELGYDGIFHNGRQDGKVWVAFDPSQVVQGVPDVSVQQLGGLTSDQWRVIDSTARTFAADQVNRIMFDFTRQNRLGEMMSSVFPFMQPFSEQFVVWSRILKQNPQMAPHVIRLYQAGLESGFLHRNQDGQLEIPLSNYLGANYILNGVFGGGSQMWKVSAAATSFNMFLQSTFPLPTGGLAGNLPIPTPGLNPEYSAIMQHFLTSPSSGEKLNPSIRTRMASWLYQYGPTTPFTILPSYLRNGLLAFGVGDADSKRRIDSMAASFENLQAYLGGTPNPGHARGQAQEMFALRVLFGLFFPTPPQISFPQSGLEQEFRDLANTMPYQDAVKEFLARHEAQYGPGIRMLTIGKTALNFDLNGDGTITDEERARAPVLSIPPVEGAMRLLAGRGAREFIAQYPQWGWALITPEMRSGKFDPAAYQNFMYRGWTSQLNPDQRGAKMKVQQGWDAYFAAKDNFAAWMEQPHNQGLSEGDVSYDAMHAKLVDSVVNKLLANNPDWAGAYNQFNNDQFTPKELATVVHLSSDKLFSQTDVGQGLKDWLGTFYRIKDEMAAAGIRSLYQQGSDTPTAAAAFLGLDKEYEKAVADIVAAHPDFQVALDVMLKGALSGVQTQYEKDTANLPADQFARIHSWDVHWNKLVQNPVTDDTAAPYQTYAYYQAKRDWIDHAMKEFPDNKTNPVYLWWEGKNALEQSQYKAQISSIPYNWLTSFDRTVVLGETTNPQAEAVWQHYNQERIRIEKNHEYDPKFVQSHAFTNLDKYMRDHAALNPVLATQIAHANEWGWAFKQSLPSLFGPNSDTRQTWNYLLSTVTFIQRQVESYRDKSGNPLTGEGDFNPDHRKLYNDWKYGSPDGSIPGLAGIINDLKNKPGTGALFAAEWDRLAKENGTNKLIDLFFPPVNYPIGG